MSEIIRIEGPAADMIMELRDNIDGLVVALANACDKIKERDAKLALLQRELEHLRNHP